MSSIDIIDEFNSLDKEEQNTVIRLGLIAYREIQNTIISEKLEEYGDKSKKEITVLHTELACLRDDISIKSKIISDLTINQQSILETERNSITTRIRKEYDDILLRLTDECSDLKKELLKFPANIIDAENRTAKQYEYIIQMLREQLSTSEERFRRENNSSLRGQDGEKADLHILQEAFPEAVIRSVGKTGHMGDFIIEFEGISILWDSKNYTGAIAKRERDKIIADVDSNPVNGGIMASSISLIQGRKNMEIELTPSGKPIIYIAKLRENDHRIIDVVRSSKNIILSCLKYLSGNQNTELRRTIHILNDKSISLKRQLEPLRTAAKSIHDSITNINNEIEDIANIIKSSLSNSIESLPTISTIPIEDNTAMPADSLPTITTDIYPNLEGVEITPGKIKKKNTTNKKKIN